MGHVEVSTRRIRTFMATPEGKRLSVALPIIKGLTLAALSVAYPGLGAAAALSIFAGDTLFKLYKKNVINGGIINGLRGIKREVKSNWNYFATVFDSQANIEDRIARGTGAVVGGVLGVASWSIAYLPFSEFLGDVGGKVAVTSLRTFGFSGVTRELAKVGFALAERQGITDSRELVDQALKSASIVTSAIAMLSMSYATGEIASSFLSGGYEFVNNLASLNDHEEESWIPPTSTLQPEETPTITPEPTDIAPTATHVPFEESIGDVPRIIEADFHAGRSLFSTDYEDLGGVDYDQDGRIDTYFKLGETPIPVAFDFNADGEWDAHRLSGLNQPWTLVSSDGELRGAYIEGLAFNTDSNSWEWDKVVSLDWTQVYENDGSGSWVELDEAATTNDTTAEFVATDDIDVVRDASGRPVYFDDESGSTTLIYGPEGGTIGLIQDLLARTHSDWTGNEIGRQGYLLSEELNELLGVKPSVRPGDTLESLLARYGVSQTDADAFIAKIKSR